MFNDTQNLNPPVVYSQIEAETKRLQFNMASDLQTGSLLRTLVSTKANCRVLELGTGTGLSASWLLSGMDANSQLISIDTDPQVQAVAQQFLGHDTRLTLICQDAGTWLPAQNNSKFDFIFADAWPGKYSYLEEALTLLNPGGIYFIDDMMQQPNWPEGHEENVNRLVTELESNPDLQLTKLNWSTGIIIGVKKQ